MALSYVLNAILKVATYENGIPVNLQNISALPARYRWSTRRCNIAGYSISRNARSAASWIYWGRHIFRDIRLLDHWDIVKRYDRWTFFLSALLRPPLQKNYSRAYHGTYFDLTAWMGVIAVRRIL